MASKHLKSSTAIKERTLTTASLPTRCALDPTATPLPSESLMSCEALTSLPKSSNLLAPSASAKTAYLPRTCLIPCVTAPPLPLLCFNDTTRTSAASFPRCVAAKFNAVAEVLSVDPSLTMMISHPAGSDSAGLPRDVSCTCPFALAFCRFTTPLMGALFCEVPYSFCKKSTASDSIISNLSCSLNAGTTSDMKTSGSSMAMSFPSCSPSLCASSLRAPKASCQQGSIWSKLVFPSLSMQLKVFSEDNGSRGTGAIIKRPT